MATIVQEHVEDLALVDVKVALVTVKQVVQDVEQVVRAVVALVQLDAEAAVLAHVMVVQAV